MRSGRMTPARSTTSDDVLIICRPLPRRRGRRNADRGRRPGRTPRRRRRNGDSSPPRPARRGGRRLPGRWRTGSRRRTGRRAAGRPGPGRPAGSASRRAWLRRAAAGRAFRPGMRPRAFSDPMCLQTAPLISKSGHVQAGLLALLDGDLVDGGALRRLLAQRPDGPEAGGRGDRVQPVTGASDRQMKGAFPVADGGRGGGRRGGSARPRGGGYSGHVRRLLNSLRTRPARVLLAPARATFISGPRWPRTEHQYTTMRPMAASRKPRKTLFSGFFAYPECGIHT